MEVQSPQDGGDRIRVWTMDVAGEDHNNANPNPTIAASTPVHPGTPEFPRPLGTASDTQLPLGRGEGEGELGVQCGPLGSPCLGGEGEKHETEGRRGGLGV